MGTVRIGAGRSYSKIFLTNQIFLDLDRLPDSPVGFLGFTASFFCAANTCLREHYLFLLNWSQTVVVPNRPFSLFLDMLLLLLGLLFDPFLNVYNQIFSDWQILFVVFFHSRSIEHLSCIIGGGSVSFG